MMPLPVVTDCTDCGACCLEQAFLPASYYVGATPATQTIPASLRAELEAVVQAELAKGAGGFKEGPCVWYDPVTKGCRHYEHRPAICRDEVKPGDEACHRWRRQYGKEPRGSRRLVNGVVVKTEAAGAG